MKNEEKPAYKEEVSPDSLMGDFRGRGIAIIVIFTVVIHAVIILCTSFSYLKTEVLGADTAEMSKDERVDAAVAEATVSIRDIAKRYELSPQEISDRFAKGGSRADKVMDSTTSGMDDPTDSTTTPPPTDTDSEPTKPLSAIEKKLQETKQGPEVPSMDEKEEDDLFEFVHGPKSKVQSRTDWIQ